MAKCEFQCPTWAMHPAQGICFQVIRHGASIDILSLDGKPCYVFGRDPRSDYPLAHKSVSREHFAVIHQVKGVVLMDLGSTRGTIVNGELVPSNVPLPLKDGDVVKVGHSTRQYILRTKMPATEKSDSSMNCRNLDNAPEECAQPALPAPYQPEPSVDVWQRWKELIQQNGASSPPKSALPQCRDGRSQLQTRSGQVERLREVEKEWLADCQADIRCKSRKGSESSPSNRKRSAMDHTASFERHVRRMPPLAKASDFPVLEPPASPTATAPAQTGPGARESSPVSSIASEDLDVVLGYINSDAEEESDERICTASTPIQLAEDSQSTSTVVQGALPPSTGTTQEVMPISTADTCSGEPLEVSKDICNHNAGANSAVHQKSIN